MSINNIFIKKNSLLPWIIFTLIIYGLVISTVVFGEVIEGKIIAKTTIYIPDSLKNNRLNYDDITTLRWIDDQNRQPITYEAWRQKTGEPGPFKTELIKRSAPLKSDGLYIKVCIIVNTDLYPLIETSLDQYIADLNTDGYDVELITSSGGTPEDLRTLLQEKYYEGMKGSVFIGDLPVAWYEIYDCFDYNENEQFPCDLFYMDLDGAFGDGDRDDLYDQHTGEVTPEIWLGRLTASPLAHGASYEDSLIINYFEKNHLYRTGQLDLNKRALVYIDDDWAGEATWWDENVGLTYDVHTLFYDEWVTWADDYEVHLLDNYEFIQVCAHSSSESHYFKNPNEEWSTTTALEVKSIEPIAHFYNLFACSNARFVEVNNMGAMYIFGDDYGLASVGSTKTGSMLNFENFYYPLGQGKTIGEAMRDWFTGLAWEGSYSFDQICWHYGMTLQGDPTLMISGWDVKFISSNNFGWAPLTVDFAGKSEHNVIQWRWNFGDTDTALAQTPEHIYDSPGIYSVGLQVLTDSSQLYTCMEDQYVVVLADTLSGADLESQAEVTFEYNINLTNNIPLYRLHIPVEYAGLLDLKYEGHIITGCRAENFESIDYINFSSSQKHFFLNMETGSEPLAPGSGTLIKIKFKIEAGEPGEQNIITFDGYDEFEPMNYGYPLIYKPVLASGTITCNVTSCCAGTTGNTDCSLEDIPDISDITRLIDFLYLSHTSLCCDEEADVDVSGGTPDISDITRLIDYLYLSHSPLPSCP